MNICSTFLTGAVKLHLLDYPKGYSDSFTGTEIRSGYGVTSHWGVKETKQTIETVLKSEIKEVKSWLKKAETLKGSINIALDQLNKSQELPCSLYGMRYPDQEYILAFLYAKIGQKDKAEVLINGSRVLQLIEQDSKLVQSIKSKLLSIEM